MWLAAGTGRCWLMPLVAHSLGDPMARAWRRAAQGIMHVGCLLLLQSTFRIVYYWPWLAADVASNVARASPVSGQCGTTSGLLKYLCTEPEHTSCTALAT